MDIDDPELDEESLGLASPHVSPPEADRQNVAEYLTPLEDVSKVKVTELKTELKRRGCSVTGKRMNWLSIYIRAMISNDQ